MPPTHPPLTYNPAFDGLRAVAIVLVLLSHAHAPMFNGAFFGVDLFFVLSGFLITTLLLKEIEATGRIDYWNFYRRRFYRLTPALAFFLATYCVVAPFVWPDLSDIYSDSLVSLLYLADYGIAFFDSPDTLLHMWSLSVEEHFYLLWPVMLMGMVRCSTPRTLWRSIALVFVLCWAWRVLWIASGQAFYEVFFRFDTRASGMVLGSLLAALYVHDHPLLQRLRTALPRLMWIPLAVPLLMVLQWGDMGALAWGLTVVEVAALIILLAALPGKGLIFEMLSAPSLVHLGKLSYGIYLWHYPIVRWLRAEFAWPIAVMLGLLASTALAALSYYTIERWALRLRDAPKSRARPTRQRLITPPRP